MAVQLRFYMVYCYHGLFKKYAATFKLQSSISVDSKWCSFSVELTRLEFEVITEIRFPYGR